MKLEEFFQKWSRNHGIGVGEQLAQDIRKAISKPFPPASRPGWPPRMRTGKLFRSIKEIRTPRGLRIIQDGRTARYGKFLEYGTKFMAARPFFFKMAKASFLRRLWAATQRRR